jgi:hypothetical protein
MHDKGKGAGATPAFSAASERDVDDQSKVMREVLEVNPEIRTRDELVRELTVASTDFEERDRIERAIQRLVAGGLLHIRAGDLVLPTQPAVHFHALDEEI